LGHLKRNQIVALAGLAPFNKDSGARKGKRSIEGGRAKIRKCLFMAAKSAARFNPVIKNYVEGLTARGKPYKCAMVAAMRKLLIHLHILIKQQHFPLVS
jgi:transposase